ncbi:hypothetical protein SUGI_0039970 [Cryptomeria japonica]|nr:hypothetical protein SUGI_0039970 [Cryptomeria japonica]
MTTFPTDKLLKKHLPMWSIEHDDVIQRIKTKCANLPPLRLPRPYPKIVESDTSEHSWGGILKEKLSSGPEEIVCYVSGGFKGNEINYHNTHKEILAVVNALKQF